MYMMLEFSWTYHKIMWIANKTLTEKFITFEENILNPFEDETVNYCK
jgi:hypothetical protein